MKKYIFVIALFVSNNIWAMKIEKYSPNPINPKKTTSDLHKDGWEIVTNINRNSGIHTPIKNKSFLESLVELNDRKNPPYLIRFFFYYKEKNKKRSKAKL